MSKQKKPHKRSIFDSPRYWYHLSSTLENRRVYLKPWDNSKGFNRTSSEPDVPRTCVSPSIEHCLTAIPYSDGDEYVIYRTARKIKATKAHGVFDCRVTKEGWIQKPCMFVKVGTLSFPQVSEDEGVTIIDEAASYSDTRQSSKVLGWWKRRHLNRHIKRT